MASSPLASDCGVACAKFIVSGKVQGVFFRASARAQAERLGLRGHARNLADGCVEVIACGSEAALGEFAGWLSHGPPSARVQAVERSEFGVDVDVGDGFRTI